ncbi:DUF3667 domain-containing protein [Mucilaginibacter ximonensis]|uniref:DUF3667 domain-containing protein n=1 Tax=Mucilaginibacter ximonensis TaxID=538021 RepID=A0ABW5YDA3_9SPHI
MTNPEKEPVGLKNIAHEALHDLMHFDSRVFRTLPALLFKPGELTVASLQPGQTRYVRPFALFVFLNFLFFIVKARGIFQYSLEAYRERFGPQILAKSAELHLSVQVLAERFNTAMHFEQKEYFIVMVPVFALVLWCLQWTRPRYFALHLIFALNYYAFLIAFLIIIPWIASLLRFIPRSSAVLNTETGFSGILLLVCLFYLGFALKKVYARAWWISWLHAAILSCTTLALIVFVYRTLLFFIVMHSIGE